MMDITNEVVKRYGIRINIGKTKVIKISREKGTLNIYLDGQKLEQVESLEYLGIIIPDDGDCYREVKARCI